MVDVFISYSRKNTAFAHLLVDALTTRQRESWVDWEGIPYSVDWWREICTGIDNADNFIVILSPDSLASEVCNKEIEYARQHHKRIIPVIYQDIDERQIAGEWFEKSWEQIARTNWRELKKLNWLFFRDTDDFDSTFAELIETVELEPEHVRTHTRLGVRATEWEANGRKNSLLLRGDDLKAAEDWLTIGVNKQPPPTDLQAEYIRVSRRVQARQNRFLVSVLVVGIVAALLLSVFGFYQSNVAQKNEAAAIAAQATSDRNAQEAQSISWAIAARDTYQRGDPFTALSLVWQANAIPDPPILAQNVLADVAYNSGVRRRFKEAATTVAISPDGRTVLSDSGYNLILLDISTGEAIRTFTGHTGGATSVTFSPDGATALSASYDQTLILWNIETGEAIRTFIGHTNVVTSVVFSPDGLTALSTSRDRTVILWDVDSGKVIHIFIGHKGYVNSVAFSPDGRTALSGGCAYDDSIGNCDKGQLILWDIIGTREAIRTFTGRFTGINSLAFSPDGRTVLSGSNDHTGRVDLDGQSLILWDIRIGEAIWTFRGHTNTVNSVVFSPDGRTALSGSDDRTLMLWDMITRQPIRTFVGHSFGINSVVFSPDAQTALSGSNDSALIIWDMARGEVIHTFTGRIGTVSSVAFSPDGLTALSGGCMKYDNVNFMCVDGSMWLWDITSGKIIRTFTGHIGEVTEVTFSPDGRTALSASYDSTLKMWNIATGQLLHTFEGHKSAVSSVTFSPDGRTILSGSYDETLILWEVESGKSIRTFTGHSFYVNAVAFSPDGSTAISGSRDNTLILWDVSSGEAIRTLKGHTNHVSSVVFSPDGRTILSGSFDHTLILWDVASGEAIRTFIGHKDFVSSVAFSPDGRTALSGSSDLTLILWDVSSGQVIRTFTGHTYAVNAVAFSPDGQKTLSGSSDNTLILWRIDTLNELMDWAQQNRPVLEALTCEQRINYNVLPLCEWETSNEIIAPFPTNTIPVWTPIASPTASDTPTPSATPSITPTIPTRTPTATTSPTP
jgi:WD40 repeat protein